MSKRLFIGVFPTGISYADRGRAKDGDYLPLAFLPYKSLEVEWRQRVKMPPELREEIEADVLRMQLRRGEMFKLSSHGGPSVKLGG